MAADAARPLPYHLAPPLLAPLAALLRQLHSSCLPLPHIPAAAAAAAVAAHSGQQDHAALEETLQRLGAIERCADSDDGESFGRLQSTRGRGCRCMRKRCLRRHGGYLWDMENESEMVRLRNFTGVRHFIDRLTTWSVTACANPKGWFQTLTARQERDPRSFVAI